MCHVDVSQLHESEVRKLTNPYHFGIVCNHNESDSETIWQKIYEKSKVAVNSVAQYDDTNTSDYFFVFRLKINNTNRIAQSGRNAIEVNYIICADLINVRNNKNICSKYIKIAALGRTADWAIMKSLESADMIGLVTTIVDSCRQTIDEFYEKNAKSIIACSDSLYERGEYLQAVNHLNRIPSSCSGYYEASLLKAKAMGEYLYFDGLKNFEKAKQEWSISQNKTGMNLATEYLCQITPGTVLDKDIEHLYNEMTKEVHRQDEAIRLRNLQYERDSIAAMRWRPRQKTTVSSNQGGNPVLALLAMAFIVSSGGAAAPAVRYLLIPLP